MKSRGTMEEIAKYLYEFYWSDAPKAPPHWFTLPEETKDRYRREAQNIAKIFIGEDDDP